MRLLRWLGRWLAEGTDDEPVFTYRETYQTVHAPGSGTTRL